MKPVEIMLSVSGEMRYVAVEPDMTTEWQEQSRLSSREYFR